MQPLESEQKRAERIERIEHEKKGKIFLVEPVVILLFRIGSTTRKVAYNERKMRSQSRSEKC